MTETESYSGVKNPIIDEFVPETNLQMCGFTLVYLNKIYDNVDYVVEATCKLGKVRRSSCSPLDVFFMACTTFKLGGYRDFMASMF